MNTRPVKFSEHFGIDKAKLKELGVFDPILNHDTKLFTDPLLLKNSRSQLMQEAFKGFQKFFSNLLLLLKKSEQIGDRPWRAAAKMVNFPEFKYTCIGYGAGTINGAGSGAVLNEKILSSAKERKRLGLNWKSRRAGRWYQPRTTCQVAHIKKLKDLLKKVDDNQSPMV